MTRRQRRRCGRCIWNKIKECGVLYCIFPKCIRGIVKEEEHGKKEQTEDR